MVRSEDVETQQCSQICGNYQLLSSHRTSALASWIWALVLAAVLASAPVSSFILRDSMPPPRSVSLYYYSRASRFNHLGASTESSNEEIAEGRGDWLDTARARLQPHFSFPLDSWQVEAGANILSGNSVIVCAPTGAGKTVVGEMALWIAFQAGMNAIYTTPLKALSNQKFVELRTEFGKENVGLATGDMSINRGARITVMTTEVYRNMAWRASGHYRNTSDDYDENELFDDLAKNSVVVLDEFHYMGQKGRGGVWEECVITSPPHTQIIGLSATLPNADRLAQWMSDVTGRQTRLVEAAGGRPVPLRYLYANSDGMSAMFRDRDAGPGAPKGLLGLRGDGLVSSQDKDKDKKRKKGFASSDKDEFDRKGRFPKGLDVNPSLLQDIKKRAQRIERKIQRLALREEYEDGYRLQSALSPREERRQRDKFLRQEMRRSVPSLPFLLRRLEQKNSLPAIFFIFSRAGCEDAAKYVCNEMGKQISDKRSNPLEKRDKRMTEKRKSRSRGRRRQQEKSDEDFYSDKGSTLAKDGSGRSFRVGSDNISDNTMASILDLEASLSDEDIKNSYPRGSTLSRYADNGLLELSQVQDVASRIAAFNKNNPELAFSDEETERFYLGVGSHHAGMIAAHKAFVESLFRRQLMKVVFATETLAAGINMPARTTVVCSMAKRGDKGSMNLLETSNLLQMAGRAGRRGMDTEGKCVIVATPFEGPTDAHSILTSEIKPIVSQFTPSYSLVSNLLTRGEGKLGVARELVEKSFAMWEQQQRDATVDGEKGQEIEEMLQVAAQERFLDLFKDCLERMLSNGEFDKPARSKSRVYAIIDTISNRKALKKESKQYIGLARILELELNTLQYLETEEVGVIDSSMAISDENDSFLRDLFSEDVNHLESEIEIQKKRVKKCERDANSHIFASMAGYCNTILHPSNSNSKVFHAALSQARSRDSEEPVTAEELTTFAKSATIVKRKMRKLAGSGLDVSSGNFLDSISNASNCEADTWQDMIALVNVLESYGCISACNQTIAISEDQTFELTPAGDNIGRLGFENSLWILVAMGGAWDVAYESAELDELRSAMDSFGSVERGEAEEEEEELSDIPKPQQEAETLISLLCNLSPSEMAGYVSSLVSEGSRGNPSVIESFMKLTPAQQPVVQSCLSALERLIEVQKRLGVGEMSSKCQLDLGTCDVVTAWASGCTWSEALEISGSAPGDLARTLHRALDALRQLSNLPYQPVRATGIIVQKHSAGLQADIRRLCREAARGMDRYPVKDPLPFDEEGEIKPDEEVEEQIDHVTDDEDGEENK